jgi:protein O-GlcNAc transferase
MEHQVFCYALSQNDGTEWRQRIQSEAEHFVDVSAMTSDVIARLINQDKIQILINLNGYTKVLKHAVHSANVAVTFIYLFIIVSHVKQ